jgi:hypothetical protein
MTSCRLLKSLAGEHGDFDAVATTGKDLPPCGLPLIRFISVYCLEISNARCAILMDARNGIRFPETGYERQRIIVKTEILCFGTIFSR